MPTTCTMNALRSSYRKDAYSKIKPDADDGLFHFRVSVLQGFSDNVSGFPPELRIAIFGMAKTKFDVRGGEVVDVLARPPLWIRQILKKYAVCPGRRP